MNRVQDIVTSDEELKNSYSQDFVNRQYLNAFNILENNSQLDSKKFTADKINLISTLLSTLQNYYQTDVGYILDELKDKVQIIIDNYVLIGEWDSSKIYQIYNFVNYNNYLYMYINNNKTSGNLPTNSNYWLRIDLRGTNGAYGTGLNLKYVWDSNKTYEPLDVVYYNDKLWVTLVKNKNIPPSTTIIETSGVTILTSDTTSYSPNEKNGFISGWTIDSNNVLTPTNLAFVEKYWIILNSIKKASIEVETNLPENPSVGLMWIEI